MKGTTENYLDQNRTTKHIPHFDVRARVVVTAQAVMMRWLFSVHALRKPLWRRPTTVKTTYSCSTAAVTPDSAKSAPSHVHLPAKTAKTPQELANLIHK